MKKRIFSIVLAMCMVLSFVPQTSFAAGETGSTPSVSAYAAKAQLMDDTFAPKSNGTAANIGKLVFGKNSSGTPQEWYILGKDSGVTNGTDNTIIFAASSIVTGQAFDGYTTSISGDGSTNEKQASGDYSYIIENAAAVPGRVYFNHYGASALHSKLQAISTESPYFTQTEQGLMNATTVTTTDTMNNLDYTTTDKLYALAADGTGVAEIKAGSSNQIVLAKSQYWNEGTSFWLRSPYNENRDEGFHDSCLALYANLYTEVNVDVYYYVTPATYDVRPAGNLKMSNVLFASAAQAASSAAAASGTIASGTAMTLRLDGSSKNIGTASYNATTGDIKATKGNTTGDVALVVQGKNGTADWYYSKKITGTENVNVSAIKSALSLTDIDLSVCKIWLETTGTDGMIYAVDAEESTAEIINSVAVTGIDAPAANTALDTNAVCETKGVSSAAPSVTWSPKDSAAGYNTQYTASVTLTAADGYEFTDATSATVNGQTANVTKNTDGTITVTYTFPATAKDKLTGITAPAPKTVDNGTAYTAMGLPETVAISTEGGTAASASVQWDTAKPASGSYDPDVLTEQTVTLNGAVTCPDNIDSNGVNLTTTIAITISAADTVEAPKANLSGGTYTSNQSVVLSSATEGAEIYYTTDGTTPSRTNGTKYTGAISVTGTEAKSVETTIKAIAVKNRMQDSSVETFTYTIEIPDTTAPTGEIKIAENSWKTFLNDITFGLFFKNTQTVTITASDNSDEAVTIEYLLSSEKLGAEDLKTAAFTTYNSTFDIDPNSKYVIYARLTDASSNVKYINSDGIVLDSVVPVISGVENGKTYCSAQTVTVTEDYIESVTVNGTPVTVTDNQFTLNPAEGTQTIVVTDKAGNVSDEMIVTVNDGHSGGIATCTSKAVCYYCKTEYGELDSRNHDIERIPANDATVIKEGNIEYWHCSDCGECFSDEEGTDSIELKDTVIPKLPPQIIKGMGQSIEVGEKKALSFTSNADFNDFLEVQLDGKTLGKANYTAVAGSIIVTLNADYVASLSAGKHTIGIVSESGTATAAFTVTEKAASGDSSGTGDNSNPALWAALILLSAAVITGLIVYSRRKRINE